MITWSAKEGELARGGSASLRPAAIWKEQPSLQQHLPTLVVVHTREIYQPAGFTQNMYTHSTLEARSAPRGHNYFCGHARGVSAFLRP